MKSIVDENLVSFKGLLLNVVAHLFKIPVIHEEKICNECVQTRRYQICVFCISIPLRVCQRERRTRCKLFFMNYGN